MSLAEAVRALQRGLAATPWRLAAGVGLYRGGGAPIQFVTERADWAIRWVGDNIVREAQTFAPGLIETTTAPHRAASRVVHFGSQYMWLAWGRHLSSSNRFVTSFFHGKREDGPAVSRHIDAFLESLPRLSRIVTAASIVENRLLAWGVPQDIVVRIAIGTDTRVFRPPSRAERAAARHRFGIPEQAVVIGSFQKDGVGWGDGMEPKPIKGPDVLIDAVAALARDAPVWVFLTGPARGYVKAGLEARDIPFVHTYASDHADLAHCYHALDLYFVTSREEGGPMGLMEAMASGIPVVSTRVGMAPDLIEPNVTGGLVEPEDVEGIAEAARAILALPDHAAILRSAARQTAEMVDWSIVARDHFDKVYRPLLRQ